MKTERCCYCGYETEEDMLNECEVCEMFDLVIDGIVNFGLTVEQIEQLCNPFLEHIK